MPKLRDRKREPLTLRNQLRAGVVRSAVIVGTVAVGVAGASGFTAALEATMTSSPPAAAVNAGHDPLPAHLTRQLARHQCSTAGFDESVIPESALVRTPRGHLRHVSFDRGWSAHTTPGGAELVAVCLMPAP